MKKGFTLVELIAALIILSIIIIITMPTIFNAINTAKKNTFESSAYGIIETAKMKSVENVNAGKTMEAIYDFPNDSFDVKGGQPEGGQVSVDVEGRIALAIYNGKWCATKNYYDTEITITEDYESCELSIETLIKKLKVTGVEPLWINRTITPDKFNVEAIYSDGTIKKLHGGGLKEGDDKLIITSPNWPENYTTSLKEADNYWEYKKEGADAIQITFDETSALALFSNIRIYDEAGTKLYAFSSNASVQGKTYIISGDYIKVTFSSSSWTAKGFSAEIKPLYESEPEYKVSPSTSIDEGNMNVNISLDLNVIENSGREVSTKTNVNIIKNTEADAYIASLFNKENNDLVEPKVIVNGEETSTGIRYVGKNPNNYVYYNCKNSDSRGAQYGNLNYNYKESCELWRIIGIFDVSSTSSGLPETRIKLIRDNVFMNGNSSVSMSWDSSSSSINYGYGVNEWSQADIKNLLNTYYIGTTTTCSYCNARSESSCSNSCSEFINPLSSIALNMIDDAVWKTGAISKDVTNTLQDAYLAERGTVTGKTCTSGGSNCNDKVTRKREWIGKVGLIYPSDFAYASNNETCISNIKDSICVKNNWMNDLYSYRTITPASSNTYANYAWYISSSISNTYASTSYSVRPSVYLKSGVKIIDGSGTSKSPYVLYIDQNQE